MDSQRGGNSNWSERGYSRGRGRGRGYDQPLACFHCGEGGHTKNNCPHKDEVKVWMTPEEKRDWENSKVEKVKEKEK